MKHKTPQNPKTGENNRQGKKTGQDRNLLPLILLLSIVLVFALSVINFALSDNAPAEDDAISHLSVAARVMHRMKGVGFTHAFMRVPYPFGVYFITSLFFLIFGISKAWAVISLLIFGITLIYTLYLLGKYFAGPWGGVAAAALIASSPYFFDTTIRYLLDMPGTALGLLTLYLLLKTEGFKNENYFMYFALSLSGTLLVKWHGAFILFVPLAIMLIRIGAQNRKNAILLMGSIAVLFLDLLYYRHMGIRMQQHMTAEKAVKFYHYLLLVLPPALLLAGTLLYGKKTKTEDKNNSLSPLLKGIGALSLAFVISAPMYLYIASALFDHARTQTVTLTLNFFLSNFRDNLLLILAGFSGVLPLCAAGTAACFLRLRKKYEMFLMGSGFISAFILTSALAPADYRYILVFAAMLALLGGFWVEYAGKFRSSLCLLIVSLFMIPHIINFIYPQDVPWLKPGHLSRRITPRQAFDQRPSNLVKPDRRRFYHSRLMEDMEQDFRNRYADREEIRMNLDIMVNRDFHEKGHSLRERQFRNDSLQYLGDYYLSRRDRYDLLHERWREFAMEKPHQPIYLFLGYLDESYPERLKEEIRKDSGRESELISQYPFPGERKIGALVILPLLPKK